MKTVNDLKMVLKILRLILLTITVMLLVYPLLHELGHAAFAVIFGADIKAAGLYPYAYVSVDHSDCTQLQTVWMLCAGSVFPLLCAVPVYKNYYLYYIGITIAVITLVSSLISVFAVFMYPNVSGGISDDYVSLLRIAPGMKAFAAIVSAGQAAIALLYIALSHPLNRTVRFFSEGSAG